MGNKTTVLNLTQGGNQKEITVNDRAATRQTIINHLTQAYKKKFVTRSEWGARAAREGLEDDWNYHSIVIHHQGNSPAHSCTILADNAKAIQNKHMDNEKWSDIGYHYLISCNGEISEGRDIRFKGSHVMKNNSQRIGILLLGDFSERGEFWKWRKPLDTIGDQIDFSHEKQLTRAQLESLELLCSILKYYFKISYLGGHREFALPDDYRTCPGNIAMKKISELRQKLRLSKP